MTHRLSVTHSDKQTHTQPAHLAENMQQICGTQAGKSVKPVICNWQRKERNELQRLTGVHVRTHSQGLADMITPETHTHTRTPICLIKLTTQTHRWTHDQGCTQVRMCRVHSVQTLWVKLSVSVIKQLHWPHNIIFKLLLLWLTA